MEKRNITLKQGGFKMTDGPEYSEKECYVDATVSIIGRVTLEKNVIVCPKVSLRADEGTPFKIRKGTNIQDSVIFHGLKDKFVENETGEKFSILIGSHCTMAHRALIHGPVKIEKFCFIGFDAIIHGSTLGRNCFVDFRATIKNSQIGGYCHIGIGAIINGVTIGDKKYIRDGQVINNQSEASLLPDVPENVAQADSHFNKEVVDFNKELIKVYQGMRSQGLRA